MGMTYQKQNSEIENENNRKPKKRISWVIIALVGIIVVLGLFIWNNNRIPSNPIEKTMALGIQAYKAENYTDALRYLVPIAGISNADAQYYLGLMYFHARGVEYSPIKAEEWFQKSANQGNVGAMTLLGVIYDTGWLDGDSLHGGDEDQEKALEWFQKAADLGDAVGQFYMGVYYEFGRVVERDFEKAAEWYQKAANQGYPDAMRQLAEMYQDGRGVEQSDIKAEEWSKRAEGLGINIYLTVTFDELNTYRTPYPTK